jgi:predicted Zn finger-like uncharacterized protein
MKFTCDRCDAQYMISDEKVGPNGVKVRCKKCSHVILVRRATENGAAAAESPIPAPAPSPGGSGEGLDAELGHAFDNAFGDVPAKAPSAGPDPDATQAVSPEEAAGMAARSAPPEPAATEWYVAIGQAQVGPLPLVEVRRKWEAGDVGPDSLVWRPGMGDWAPLTGVSDLAAYLAPVARGARPQPQSAAAQVSTKAATATAAATEPRRTHDVSWKPVGASALAALASEEIAGKPAEPESKPVVSPKSLVDGLPDGGGVDPTGAVPLQIKALESTGEAPVARSSVARGAEQIRKKRSSSRMLAAVIVVLVLALVGGGAYVGYDRYLRPRMAASPPTPVAAEKPAPPAAEKPAPPAEKPAEPATAAAPAAPAPAAQPAPPPATPAEPVATTAVAPPPVPPPAAKEAEKPKPEPARPARTSRAEKRAAQKAERIAAREEPAPKPAPQPAAQAPKKKGGDLLDFDSNDAALDDALGGKGSSGRSVYVPPAPGGGDELADRVTDSQITETIMTRVAALQQCAADKSSGSGVLKMNWAINPDGSVRNLKCVSPEYASTPFTTCVTTLLKGLKFPKSANGRPDVTFPFKF